LWVRKRGSKIAQSCDCSDGYQSDASQGSLGSNLYRPKQGLKSVQGQAIREHYRAGDAAPYSFQ